MPDTAIVSRETSKPRKRAGPPVDVPQATQAIIALRVKKVYELLLDGWSRGLILQSIAEIKELHHPNGVPVSERTLDIYLKAALEIIEKETVTDMKKMREWHFHNRMKLLREADAIEKPFLKVKAKLAIAQDLGHLQNTYPKEGPAGPVFIPVVVMSEEGKQLFSVLPPNGNGIKEIEPQKSDG